MEQRRIEATRQRLVDGVTAGCVATLVMTGVVLAAPALGGGRLPLRAAEAVGQLRGHPFAALVIFAVHLAYGSLAGGLFAVGARRISIGRSVSFALGLWAVAIVIYAPLTGLGFIASNAPGLAAFALPAHLLYGLALGALAPRGEIVQPITDHAVQSGPPIVQI
jgi:hypothetical protein